MGKAVMKVSLHKVGWIEKKKAERTMKTYRYTCFPRYAYKHAPQNVSPFHWSTINIHVSPRRSTTQVKLWYNCETSIYGWLTHTYAYGWSTYEQPIYVKSHLCTTHLRQSIHVYRRHICGDVHVHVGLPTIDVISLISCKSRNNSII